MPITAFYAGCLALLLFWLSVRVIGVRRSAKIAVGDAGDQTLLRRMRAQANFTEYVPLALILIGLAETLGGPRLLLHGLGATLLIGRLVHAVGISRTPEPMALRVTGMAMTFTVLLVGAASCIVLGGRGAF